MVVGAGLIASGLLVIFGVGHRLEEEALVELAAHEAEEMHVHAQSSWRALIPPALLIGYVLIVGWLGFVPTAALIVLIISLALGARLSLALPLAIVTPLAVHLIFAKLLRVPLPAGLLPMPW
jgi:putative tricarboxylic transport membrane protein